MSEYAQYYESFSTGRWATEDAATCRCNGGGWALSEVDTWHKCPAHYTPGQSHPDDDGEWLPMPYDSPCKGCGCEIHGEPNYGGLCGTCFNENIAADDDLTDVPF